VLLAAKPIDLLAQYISAEEELDAIEMHEPYTYLNGLTVSDLEDLIEDIKVSTLLHALNPSSSWCLLSHTNTVIPVLQAECL
jgi:hypothetical protein